MTYYATLTACKLRSDWMERRIALPKELGQHGVLPVISRFQQILCATSHCSWSLWPERCFCGRHARKLHFHSIQAEHFCTHVGRADCAAAGRARKKTGWYVTHMEKRVCMYIMLNAQ